MNDFTKLQPVLWLEPCCNCLNSTVYVEGNDQNPKVLNVLDNVYCSCGQTGYIDVLDGNSFVCWNELSSDDWKYNKLKVKYDKAIHLLMLSDYGDVNYLKRFGAI